MLEKNIDPDYELMIYYEWSNSNMYIFEPWGSCLNCNMGYNPIFDNKMVLFFHTSFELASINYINQKMVKPKFKNVFLIHKDAINRIVEETEKTFDITLNKETFIIGVMSMHNESDKGSKSHFKDFYLPIIKKYTFNS